MDLEVNPLQQRIQLLRQLVRDSQYAVDETTVANAIVARMAARRLVSEATFRNDPRVRQVSSFRPSREVRSFRLCNPARSHDGGAAIAWQRR
jgi:hypothetical protein